MSKNMMVYNMLHNFTDRTRKEDRSVVVDGRDRSGPQLSAKKGGLNTYLDIIFYLAKQWTHWIFCSKMSPTFASPGVVSGVTAYLQFFTALHKYPW